MRRRIRILVVLLLAIQQAASAFIHPQQDATLIKLHLSNRMSIDPPPKTSPSRALYNLISENRRINELNEDAKAIPLAGVHDALSAKIFAQKGAPALFLSGFGVSASLLGIPGEICSLFSVVCTTYWLQFFSKLTKELELT
jgi:hypothetical protein